MPATLAAADATALPLHLVTAAGLESWLASQPEATAAWVRSTGFTAEAGKVLPLPGPGGLGGALAGVEQPLGLWSLAGLPALLPGGAYRLAAEPPADKATALATGWLLGGYRFDRFKRPAEKPAAETALVPPAGADAELARKSAAAVTLTRDLVNTPAAEMGPAELAAAAEALAAEFGAGFRAIVGDDLLSAGYPAVHAVGRAALRAPRLIDLTWGEADAPKVTLVGKGVCFDSGGLDIKPASGMRNMKKDMGGAATVLGLARLVMDTGLPVRLRVLVPAVENAISGDAFRPGDILRTRKGLTVEVGNTDAEGRLVLA
ncbi:MAG: leucyl aminopeptidase family protein, partial [Gammaproteobacteria bacterium]|nr:leucyl aminopeptidase family protein [Gammaproteobacteria bacterium]